MSEQEEYLQYQAALLEAVQLGEVVAFWTSENEYTEPVYIHHQFWNEQGTPLSVRELRDWFQRENFIYS
jgi:hypothetical protein